MSRSISAISCFLCGAFNCKLWVINDEAIYNPLPIKCEKLYCLFCLYENRLKLKIRYGVLEQMVNGVLEQIVNGVTLPFFDLKFDRSRYDILPAIPDDYTHTLYAFASVPLSQTIIWQELNSFPEWWKIANSVNYQRALNLAVKLGEECHRLGLKDFASSVQNNYNVYLMHDKYGEIPITIPEVYHIISWLEKLTVPITAETFCSLCSKIRNKYCVLPT